MVIVKLAYLCLESQASVSQRTAYNGDCYNWCVKESTGRTNLPGYRRREKRVMMLCEKQVRPVRWPSTGSNGDQNWCGKKDVWRWYCTKDAYTWHIHECYDWIRWVEFFSLTLLHFCLFQRCLMTTTGARRKYVLIVAWAMPYSLSYFLAAVVSIKNQNLRYNATVVHLYIATRKSLIPI